MNSCKRRRSVIPIVGDMLCSLVTLPLALKWVYEGFNEETGIMMTEIILGALLLITSFAYMLRYTEPSTPTFEDALWYCFAIITTIGFGDVAATTLTGRIISVTLGMYGIVVVALITSIIVNYYGEMQKEGDRGEAEQGGPPA